VADGDLESDLSSIFASPATAAPAQQPQEDEAPDWNSLSEAPPAQAQGQAQGDQPPSWDDLSEHPPDWDSLSETPPSDLTSSAAGAATRGFVRGGVNATGALPFMAAGAEGGAALGLATGPLAPIASPVLAVVGGIGGGIIGGFLTDELQNAVRSMLGQDTGAGFFSKTQEQADTEQHPTAQLAGNLLGQLPAFGDPAAAIGQRLVNAGAQGGMQAVQEKLENDEINPTDVGMAAAVGLLTGAPRPWTKPITSLATRYIPGRPDTAGVPPPRADVPQPGEVEDDPDIKADPTAVTPTVPPNSSLGTAMTLPKSAEAVPNADGTAKRTAADIGNSQSAVGAGDFGRNGLKEPTPAQSGTTLTQGQMDVDVSAALAARGEELPIDTGIAEAAQGGRNLGGVARAPLPGDDLVAASRAQREATARVQAKNAGQEEPEPDTSPAINPDRPAVPQQRQTTPDTAPTDVAQPPAGEVPAPAAAATNIQDPNLPGVTIDRTKQVPYLAGSSNDATKVYIDSRVPHQMDVNGKIIDPAQPLAVHEIYERNAIEHLQEAVKNGTHAPMSAADIYAVAHERAGTAAERAYLQKHHGFTDADWTEYQRQMKALVPETEHGATPAAPPADLYTEMYPHEQALHLHEEAGAAVRPGEVQAPVQTPGESAGSGAIGEAPAPKLAKVPGKERAALDFGRAPIEPVTAAVKVPGKQLALKLLADHPTLPAEAKAAIAEKLKSGTAAQVKQVYDRLRRDRPKVEGLDVVAKDKGDAARKAGALKAIKDAYAAHAPADDSVPVAPADRQALADRLTAAVKAASDANGGQDPLAAYKPREKPAEYQWLAAAKLYLAGAKTPKSTADFIASEKTLRGGATREEQAVRRGEADIGQSRRSGEDAVEEAHVTRQINPHDEEDAMIERIDAQRAKGVDPNVDSPFTARHPAETGIEEAPSKWKSAEAERLAAIAEKNAKLRAARVAAAKEGKPLQAMNRDTLTRARQEGEGGFMKGERPITSDQMNPKGTAGIMERLNRDIPEGSAYSAKVAAHPLGQRVGSGLEYARSLSDRLHTLVQERVNRRTALLQRLQALPKEMDGPMLEKLYKAKENGTLNFLPENERDLYNQHLKQLFDQTDQLYDNIEKQAPGLMGPKVENHVYRIRQGYIPDHDTLDPLRNPNGSSANPIEGRSISAGKRGPMNDRTFMALEREDGQRTVISPQDGGFTRWNKYRADQVTDPNFTFKDGETYTDQKGNKYTMGQARTEEIEKNARFGPSATGQMSAPAKYYKNAALSAAMAADHLGTVASHLQAVNAIKTSPDFLAHSTSNKATADANGWKPTKQAQFKGLYMDPALAHTLDDFNQPGFDEDSLNWARGLSQAVTKTLFWMPIAHMANVGAHWFVGRGWNWITPQGYRSLAVNGARAIKSVITQDEYQQSIRRQGAGSVYGGVATQDFLGQTAKAVGIDIAKNPSKWDPIAKVLGFSPPELAKAIYDGSSRTMWAANDMFLTQAVMEKEDAGLSRRAAIAAAEKHIPNYRVPINVLTSGNGGRFMSKMMQDPTFMAFGRYHYGVFNSYAHMVKDITSGDGARTVEAVGNLMALGVLAFAVKPVLDKMARYVTGNKDADEHPRGPLAIPSALLKAAQGKTDPMEATRDTMTLSPLLSTSLEALSNRDFTGKNVVQPGDFENAAHGSPKAMGKVAIQEGEHAARGLLSPVNTLENAAGKGESPLGAIRDQAIDARNPSVRSVKFENKAPGQAIRDAHTRDKRPPGQIERLYNNMLGN
jgi:hypothetical protein